MCSEAKSLKLLRHFDPNEFAQCTRGGELLLEPHPAPTKADAVAGSSQGEREGEEEEVRRARVTSKFPRFTGPENFCVTFRNAITGKA